MLCVHNEQSSRKNVLQKKRNPLNDVIQRFECFIRRAMEGGAREWANKNKISLPRPVLLGSVRSSASNYFNQIHYIHLFILYGIRWHLWRIAFVRIIFIAVYCTYKLEKQQKKVSNLSGRVFVAIPGHSEQSASMLKLWASWTRTSIRGE